TSSFDANTVAKLAAGEGALGLKASSVLSSPAFSGLASGSTAFRTSFVVASDAAQTGGEEVFEGLFRFVVDGSVTFAGFGGEAGKVTVGLGIAAMSDLIEEDDPDDEGDKGGFGGESEPGGKVGFGDAGGVGDKGGAGGKGDPKVDDPLPTLFTVLDVSAGGPGKLPSGAATDPCGGKAGKGGDLVVTGPETDCVTRKDAGPDGVFDFGPSVIDFRFDYALGEQLEFLAQLSATARDGLTIDLLNSARISYRLADGHALTEVGDGTVFDAVQPIPIPPAALLLLSGFGIASVVRRRAAG
ncbi:MAG: hypothetical protein AAF763_17250, partial [Pseudomonadota bacterium]